jgi:hypothetical protein
MRLLSCLLLLALTVPARAGDAAALQAIYAASAQRLADSPFHRPLYLESAESPGTARGDVYAVIGQGLDALSTALADPAGWCEVLLLHPNVAQCRASPAGNGRGTLAVNFARRFDQKLDQTDRADLAFSQRAAPGWIEVHLDGDKGPMGTSDYHFVVEAVPAGDGKSFLHLGYSYSYGFAARMATHMYFATSGSDKIGFTTEAGRDGKSQPVGGLRGAVERNVMRYYLAIETWLGARGQAPSQRFETSLTRWLDAIEEYPRQLGEEDRAAYARVKRSAYERQSAG